MYHDELVLDGDFCQLKRVHSGLCKREAVRHRQLLEMRRRDRLLVHRSSYVIKHSWMPVERDIVRTHRMRWSKAGLTDEVGMLAVNANRKIKRRGKGGDGEDGP